MTLKTISNGPRENGAKNQGTDPYRLTFTIERTWGGLPGRILKFPLRMYLSGEMQAKREATIGLDPSERNAALMDFRVRVLADALEDAPEGFPDFPETVTAPEIGETSSLAERAYQFFSRKDARGRRVFQFLIEDVVNEYWNVVLPDPTSAASESSLGKPNTTDEG